MGEGVVIKGLEKMSLIDYPPYAAAVIFFPLCNFRCPYCHNSDLVINSGGIETIHEAEVVRFLEDRKRWLDAVVITGGEPTLHAGLPHLVRKIKSLGYKVKLDTNGTNPEMVMGLIDDGLVDYIAMDIKAPLDRYESVTISSADKGRIRQSIVLIMESGVDYEFRTTVLPRLISKEDIGKIGSELKGAKRYVLQQFRPKGVIDKEYENEKAYTKEELIELKKIAEKHIKEVILRGAN